MMILNRENKKKKNQNLVNIHVKQKNLRSLIKVLFKI